MEAPEKNIVPMTNMQKVMAVTMSKSKSNAPHFYMSIEVDTGELQYVKDILKGRFPELKVTYTPLIAKVVAQVLKDFPKLNASFLEGYKIEFHDHVNMGVAVSTERGLIVPVVKEVDSKDIKTIIMELNELIDRTRAGRPTREDLAGGTFTLTNAGMYGVRQFTAIIKPPEAAILAIGAILQRPMVRAEKIEIRSVMEMTISADHRITEGAMVAEFLGRLKVLFESRENLLQQFPVS